MKLRNLFITLFSLFGLFSCNDNKEQIQKVEKRTLDIYALNDFHGSYLYDEDYSQTGLSRIGKFLMDKKQNNSENTIILSSGDMFQGGAESNITKGKVVIDTMNEIGFDSMTIGNHEFDWGEETLKEMEKQMDFPLLGINVFYKNTTKRPPYLVPSIVVEHSGLKVGIIGGIMPGIEGSILSTIASNYDYSYSEDLIKNEAKRLRNKEKCDVVILSAHDGSYRTYKDLSEDLDALFLGHSHNKIEGKYNDMPYIQGRHNGDYISNIKLDLVLNKDTNKYEVTNCYVQNIDTFSTCKKESVEINNVYNSYKNEIESIRDEVLYTFNSNVSESEFGTYMSKALVDYVNANNKVFKYQVVSGSMNNGGVRCDISSGEFTYGDLIKVYPFENVVTLLKLNSNQYDSFMSNGYVYTDSTIKPVDGYYYVVTNDYTAYKTNREEIYPYQDYLIRDLVADNLKTNGYY